VALQVRQHCVHEATDGNNVLLKQPDNEDELPTAAEETMKQSDN
jgi:hypothetical protein